MSYLLDALQKSQSERSSQAPNLQTSSILVEVPDEARPSIWIFIALAALLINTALLVILLWHGNSASSTAVVTRAAELTTANPAPIPAADSRVRPGTTGNPVAGQQRNIGDTGLDSGTGLRRSDPPAYMEQFAAGVNSNVNDNTGNGYAEIVVRDRTSSAKSTASVNTFHPQNAMPVSREEAYSQVNGDPVSNAIASVSANQSPSSSSSSLHSSGPLTRVDELPLDMRKQLPEMEMNSHIYSEHETDSFIMINGASLTPGMALNNDLKLITVTADGAVMDYRGTRFLLPALAHFVP